MVESENFSRIATPAHIALCALLRMFCGSAARIWKSSAVWHGTRLIFWVFRHISCQNVKFELWVESEIFSRVAIPAHIALRALLRMFCGSVSRIWKSSAAGDGLRQIFLVLGELSCHIDSRRQKVRVSYIYQNTVNGPKRWAAALARPHWQYVRNLKKFRGLRKPQT